MPIENQAELRRMLAQYPGATPESIEEAVERYEEREEAKQELMATRGMSNRMAESFLDRQGWPRPPGWHSVVFYPDSNFPRTQYFVLFLVLAAAIWFLLGS